MAYQRHDFIAIDFETAWKDAYWEQDLQKAFDASKRMAEYIFVFLQ